MKKILLLLFLPVIIIFSACSKNSKDAVVNDGTALNTRTFTEGSKVCSGGFVFDAASLNTFLQGNNSYTFGMPGVEKNSSPLYFL